MKVKPVVVSAALMVACCVLLFGGTLRTPQQGIPRLDARRLATQTVSEGFLATQIHGEIQPSPLPNISFDPGRRDSLVFIHIQKTGGSDFLQHHQSCISHESNLPEEEQRFDPSANFHYSTMLRHPVLRYISEYLHIQRGATFSYRHICNGKKVKDEEMPPCYPGYYDHATWENVTLSAFLSCQSNWANNRQ